jgi:N-acetylmuramoyl-L-alanine amidase
MCATRGNDIEGGFSMRAINRIIWHCSATREGQDIKVEDIRRWHVQDRGWSDIGYHYVIELDGTVRTGRPLDRMGAHVAGHNRDTVGVCYIGGLDGAMRPKDTRTEAQKAALYQLTAELIGRFPGATVHGHNEYAAKACPCFDAHQDWLNHTLTLAIAREEIAEEEEVFA